MKKILYLFMFVLLFVSCNASILMNNGETPKDRERREEGVLFLYLRGKSDQCNKVIL